MSKCAFMRAKLAQTVAELRQAGLGEKFATAGKAGWLASAKTFGRNLVGNSMMAGGEYFLTQSTAAVLDYGIAVAKSARTNLTVPPSAFREIPFPSIAGLRWGREGWREGLAKAVEVMRTGVDADLMTQKFDVQRTTFDNPALNTAVHKVFDLLESSDKPFFQLATKMSLFNQAEVLAIREGLRGKARTARVDALVRNPSDEMVLRAMEDAQYATFKNETVLGTLASDTKAMLRRRAESTADRTVKSRSAQVARSEGLRGDAFNARVAELRKRENRAELDRLAPTPAETRREAVTRQAFGAASVVSELVVPFPKVPSAILSAGIDYSPLGFAKTLIEQLPAEARSQSALSKGMARAMVGTGLTFTVGYALAKSGKLTGSRPTSTSEAALWDAENKPENSLRIGGRWYSLTPLIPVALPALLGANLYHAHVSEPDQDAIGQAGQMLALQAKTMSELPFLQGLDNVASALKEATRYGPKALAGMVPVPAIVGQVSAGLDPTVRAPETVTDRITAKTPLSRTLPERRDVFGRVAKRADSPATGLPLSLLDITNSREAKDDSVTREMSRLRVFPSRPARNVTIRGKTFKRTGEEYSDLLGQSGPALHKALSDVIATETYRRLSDDAKAIILRRVMDRVRESATSADKARRASTMARP